MLASLVFRSLVVDKVRTWPDNFYVACSQFDLFRVNSFRFDSTGVLKNLYCISNLNGENTDKQATLCFRSS